MRAESRPGHLYGVLVVYEQRARTRPEMFARGCADMARGRNHPQQATQPRAAHRPDHAGPWSVMRSVSIMQSAGHHRRP